MSLDAKSVIGEALALPRSDRVLVVAELLASISDPEQDYSPAAADEFARALERRIGRVESGESEGIGFDVAMEMIESGLTGR